MRLLARFRKWRWRRRWPLYSRCWYCSTTTGEHFDLCPVPNQDTDALLATVRAGIRIHPDEPTDVMVDLERNALAALDSLAAELEQLQKYGPMTAEGHVSIELHTLQEMEAELERMKRERDHFMAHAETLDADLERVKAERDEFVVITNGMRHSLDKALSALREIADGEKVLGQSPAFLREVARAAIAEIEGEAT
jgi:hypothetical protein